MTRTAAVKAAAAQSHKANNLTLPMNSQTLNFSTESGPEAKRGGGLGASVSRHPRYPLHDSFRREDKALGPQSKALINFNITTGNIASNNTITITRPGRI
jgi:hypothetical protein